MTDQTTPAGLTRDQAQAVREWAERSYAAEVQDETMYHAARVLLAVLPKRPTLADMTEEERAACQWMQADIEPEGRTVILRPDTGGVRAALLVRGGSVIYEVLEQVTPRPDLPRMEWPGDQKAAPEPAPALPEGWRLADHPKYGRVIVTNAIPNRNGHVYFVHRAADRMGCDWHRCDPAELTYLDQEVDQ